MRERFTQRIRTGLAALLAAHWLILVFDFVVLDGYLGDRLDGWLFIALFAHQLAFILGAGFFRAYRLLFWPLWYLTQLGSLLLHPGRLKQLEVWQRVERVTPVRVSVSQDETTLSWSPSGEAREEVRELERPEGVEGEPPVSAPDLAGDVTLERGQVSVQLSRHPSDGARLSVEVQSLEARDVSLNVALDADALPEGVDVDALPKMQVAHEVDLGGEQGAFLSALRYYAEAAGVDVPWSPSAG